VEIADRGPMVYPTASIRRKRLRSSLGYTTYTIVTDTDVTEVSVLLFFTSAVLFPFGLLSEQIAALRLVNRGDD